MHNSFRTLRLLLNRLIPVSRVIYFRKTNRRTPMEVGLGDSSASELASELVKAGGEEWRRAEVRLGCSLALSAVVSVCDNEVFTKELIFPKYIKERECIDLVNKIEKRKQARTGMQAVFEPNFPSWVKSLPDSNFEERDVYRIQENLRTLILFWQDHENANARLDKREAEIRSGVDLMIKLAFEYRDEAIHTHRLETDLFLPAAPWVARADNVCMVDLPVEWVDFLRKLPNKHIFCSDDNALSVITFICEYKVKDRKQAARQLTLDLCSAQHQRRALGFEDSKIFGATSVDTEMRFFVSEWEGDNIHVSPTTKRFDLKSFGQYLSCYIFLCGLADLEASNIRSTFDMWQSEEDKQKIMDHNIAESQKKPWRPLAPPSGFGSRKRKRGEDEENYHMESAYSRNLDEFEDDADEHNSVLRKVPQAVPPQPRTHPFPVPGSVRSTSVASSKIASKLVREGEEEWRDAAARLGCKLFDFGPASGERDMRENEVFAKELTYPKCIKEQEYIDMVNEAEEEKQLRQMARFHPTYVSWVNSLVDSSFEEKDNYDIRKLFCTLVFNWDDHEIANARVERREPEIRFGADALIKMAFQLRRKHIHRMETDLLLPASPWVTKADNVCMIDLPAEWLLFLGKLPSSHIFSSDERSCAVITFIYEGKVNEHKYAARQLTLDLCSAQHQRRALGFEDSKIFGATLVDTVLHFFVSEWEGDIVHVYPTNKRFDLKTFDEYLSCYVFLSRLADFEAANVQMVFDLWRSEKDKQKIMDHNIAVSKKVPWRPLAPPPASGSKKRKQGDGDYMENEEDKELPPGGLSLSKQYLQALDHFTPPGPLEIDKWVQNSASICDGVV